MHSPFPGLWPIPVNALRPFTRHALKPSVAPSISPFKASALLSRLTPMPTCATRFRPIS